MTNSNTNFKEFTENQDLAVKVYFEHQKNTDVWMLHPHVENVALLYRVGA